MKTPCRFKDLTKSETKHLRDVAGVTTLRDFKETAAAHVNMRAANPRIEPCFECKNIARKQGLPV